MLPAEIPYVCQSAVAAWLAEARNPVGREREGGGGGEGEGDAR